MATVHQEGALGPLWEARLVLSSDPVLSTGQSAVHTATVQSEEHDLPHATLG